MIDKALNAFSVNCGVFCESVSVAGVGNEPEFFDGLQSLVNFTAALRFNTTILGALNNQRRNSHNACPIARIQGGRVEVGKPRSKSNGDRSGKPSQRCRDIAEEAYVPIASFTKA